MSDQISFFSANKDLAMAGANAMQRGGRLYGGAWDSATASGMAYLVGELEKVDPKIREPLSNTTWPRDIVAKTGGGWVDYISTFDMDYGTTGANENSIVGSGTTAVPVMQVNTNKNLYKAFTWMQAMQVPLIDRQKLQKIGRSLEDMLNKGIRLNYNKTLDLSVYKGLSKMGTTGLLNDANVVADNVAQNAANTSRKWVDKTADEILTDINTAITAAWVASEYDDSGIPNHVLIPPQQYAYLVSHKVSDAGNVSILNYLLDNNIAKDRGVDLTIEPCRWCVGAGTGATDRMMVYVNDEDKVNFDITVPLTRAMTQPSVERAAYLTLYASQFGQVKFMYYQPVRYYDGI